jgi:hypothetical protein
MAVGAIVASPLTLNGQVVDSVRVPVSATTGGTRNTCKVSERTIVNPPEHDAVDSLIIRIVNDADQDAATQNALEIDVGPGVLVFDISEGSALESKTIATGTLPGKTIAITAKRDHSLVCAIGLPPTGDKAEPVEADPAFQLVYGLEYSSATHFESGKTRPVAAAEWVIPFTGSIWNRINLVAFADLTSGIKQTNFGACTVVEQEGPQFPRGRRSVCSGKPEISDTSALVFPPTQDSTVYETAATWRIGAMPRAEWAIGRTGTYLGIAGLVGIQTSLRTGDTDQLGFFWGGGFSLSMVGQGAKHSVNLPAEERFSLQVLYGQVEIFSENSIVRITPNAIDTLPPDTVRIAMGDGPPRRGAFQVRLLLKPLKNWYMRGIAQVRRGGPDLAQFAILKPLDLGKFFDALGIK